MTLESLLGSTALYQADVSRNTSSELVVMSPELSISLAACPGFARAFEVTTISNTAGCEGIYGGMNFRRKPPISLQGYLTYKTTHPPRTPLGP